ncbi:MAG: ABC transporter permease [Enterovibrio sp.]
MKKRLPSAGTNFCTGKLLAIGLMSLIFMPLCPGLYQMGQAIAHIEPWQAIAQDSQTVAAAIATLISTLISAALSLALAVSFAMAQYPFKTWHRATRKLPILLAMPHAAFAIGFIFLFSPTGWLTRVGAFFLGWDSPPDWVTVQDPYGISLGIALAIKESFFLLWIIMSLLSEQQIAHQMLIARSMGYRRQQIWRSIILPQLLPRMAWPFAAVVAYSLSAVDVALILGPTTPPTFAVLVWQWLADPDPLLQGKGSAGALILLLALLLIGLVLRLAWRLHQCRRLNFDGLRQNDKTSCFGHIYRGGVWVCFALMSMLLLWSVADGWFFPALWPETLSVSGWLEADFSPLQTSLWLGLSSSLIALSFTLIWLEWGPQHSNALLYAPLILPVIPLAAAQYFALLRLNLDGTQIGLIWSHLLWVLPYILLSLVSPYRQFDPRIMLTAQTLGYSRLKACLKIKWPLLLRPILAALALGFAVSIAQYLPTLFAGGGRFSTVTTEAVALSSGGHRPTIAVQAVLQILLPMAMFALVALHSHWRGLTCRGLR